MTESAVANLLKKLGNLLRQERDLLRDIWWDIVYIKDELLRMRTFLKNLDEENANQEIKTWVDSVRIVSYDANDLLDELMLKLVKDDHEIPGFLDTMSHHFKAYKARSQISCNIQDIKSRVRSASLKYEEIMYSGINDPSKRTWFDPRADALLLEEGDLVGISEPKSHLIDFLMEGKSRIEVISVVGMGGLGKTTLVKTVYDDHQVKTRFHVRAWVTVSPSFRAEDLLRHILQHIVAPCNKKFTPQELKTSSCETMKILIEELLRWKRYLIIFDDVWDMHAWESIKYALPINNLHSRVILTTRDLDVAAISCAESPGKVYALKPLSEKDSWTLFCGKAFQRDNLCPPYLETTCRNILNRCEGLPLAIVAIGGLLSTKYEGRVDEWEMVYRSLGAELETSYWLQKLRETLSLSYINLPYYLRDCFLYMCVFPEDKPIECTRLVRLWVAERFVKEKEGIKLEDVGESYLNRLINKNVVQVVGTTHDGKVHACRIHSIMRAIILSESREQNIAEVVTEHHTKWPEKIRRLSVVTNIETVQDKDLSRLRSLFIYGSEVEPFWKEIKNMVHNNCSSFMLLKVLDVQGTQFKTNPDEIFGLVHLKYLCLRDTNVEILPSSIGNLRYLEFLDLKRTCVSELPVEICNLQKLRHLLLYRYKLEPYVPYHYLEGFKAPSEIRKLQSLQKLCFVDSNHEREIVENLESLTNLRRLGITKLKREDGMALCFSIEKLRNLISLNIHAIDEEEFIDMEHVTKPPLLLQRLYLHGRLKKLPDWIQSLHCLAKLLLRWSQLKDEPLECLGLLPNLAELQLRQAYQGHELRFKGGWFQRLKILLLDEMEELRNVYIEEGTLPSLEELTLMHCQFLEEVPAGIEHLHKLKSIRFFDMPLELHESLRPSKRKRRCEKIAHVPQICFTKWEKGQWKTYNL